MTKAAQRVAQGVEIITVVSPLVDATLTNRLPNLLRAWRSYVALITMKLYTRLLERQTAKIEKLTHLAL